MTFVEWLNQCVDEKCNGNTFLFAKPLSSSHEAIKKYLEGKTYPQRTTLEEMVLVHDLHITREVFEDYCLKISKLRSTGCRGGSTTLCWDCKNSVPDTWTGAGCSWSRKFIPVEGWNATYCEYNTGVYMTPGSYHVISCPQFKPDNASDPIISQIMYDDDDSKFTETAEYILQRQKKLDEVKAKQRTQVQKRCEYQNENRARINRNNRERYQKMKTEDPELFKAIQDARKAKAHDRYVLRKMEKLNQKEGDKND